MPKEKTDAMKVAVARRVHFVEEDGRHIDAVVTKLVNDADSTVNLMIFPPQGHSADVQNIKCDASGKTPGTWHFIEK